MKEIGGYFELDDFINNEYHHNLIALNSARSALVYLIKTKNIKKLYIPYYLCDAVSSVLNLNKCDYEYYNIGRDFKPLFNKKLDENEYLYLVNYFGQINTKLVMELKKEFHNIILDNAQAFFQKPISDVDTIYSCRKFFGVSDGAYLSTNNLILENLEIDISKDRMKHILGRYEGHASDYYTSFQKNEESLENAPIKYMSRLTRNILGAIDYERIRKIRNNNYHCLDTLLNPYNMLKIKTPEVAFSYPFYINNGIEIRKMLNKCKVYTPILWPNVLREISKEFCEYDYAANLIILPCDQRYGIKDMELLVEIIKEYL